VLYEINFSFQSNMSLFGGGSSQFGGTGVFGNSAAVPANVNPMKDIEVQSPPDDSVSSLEFSPGTLPSTFLVAGSWDNNVSCRCFVYSLFISCSTL
jgi:mRNA export factor